MRTLFISMILAIGGSAMPSPRLIVFEPPPGYMSIGARDVSADGRTVAIGMLTDSLIQHAFTWRAETGFVRLEGERVQINGMSDDGQTLGGVQQSGGQQGVRWDANGRLTVFPNLASVHNVSGDGKLLANDLFGWGYLVPLVGEAVPLGFGSPYESNYDASVVVGGATDAIRWTQSTGPVTITQRGERRASALATDGVGQVVGGFFKFAGNNPPKSFLWTPESGAKEVETPLSSSSIRSISDDGMIVVSDGWIKVGNLDPMILADFFRGAGIDVSEWESFSVGRMSPDGKKIVGAGRYRGRVVAYLFIDDRPKTLQVTATRSVKQAIP